MGYWQHQIYLVSDETFKTFKNWFILFLLSEEQTANEELPSEDVTDKNGQGAATVSSTRFTKSQARQRYKRGKL